MADGRRKLQKCWRESLCKNVQGLFCIQAFGKASNLYNFMACNIFNYESQMGPFGNESPEYRVDNAKMLGTVLHMMQGTPLHLRGRGAGHDERPLYR